MTPRPLGQVADFIGAVEIDKTEMSSVSTTRAMKRSSLTVPANGSASNAARAPLRTGRRERGEVGDVLATVAPLDITAKFGDAWYYVE